MCLRDEEGETDILTRPQSYREAYNIGEEVNLSLEKNPHNVSGILKLYLRELADPLIPFDFYADFMAAETCSNQDAKKGYTRHLVRALPKMNRVTLKYLIQFLRKVDSHKGENNMAIHNLATVFGPNLVRSKNETMFSMAAATAQANSAVHTLIGGFDVVFGEAPLVLPNDKPTGQTAEALFDYEGKGPRELSFKANNLLCIVHIGVDGWWRGGIGENFGRFPGSYVREISENTAVRLFRKQQYMIKMEELSKQVEEEEARVREMEEQREGLLRGIDDLKMKKEESVRRSAGTINAAKVVWGLFIHLSLFFSTLSLSFSLSLDFISVIYIFDSVS